MKKITSIALFVFAFMLCSADTAAQQRFSAVVTDADRWDTVEFNAPDECAGTPEECAVAMLTELNIPVGEEPLFSVYPIGPVDEKNVTVVFVSHFVEDDDSVLGKLYRLELTRSSDETAAFNLEGLGRMFQCMRGPVGWRKTLCP